MSIFVCDVFHSFGIRKGHFVTIIFFVFETLFTISQTQFFTKKQLYENTRLIFAQNLGTNQEEFSWLSQGRNHGGGGKRGRRPPKMPRMPTQAPLSLAAVSRWWLFFLETNRKLDK